MRPRRILDGVRVLDLSRVLSGPHAGRVLADMGADVIKLEPPDGDSTRTALPRPGGIAVYHVQQNAGKRNVSIDLKHPEGARIALELAVRSDVLLENYRPGVLDRLGLGYDAVRSRNPRVVYCSLTGYGSDGPAAQRRAYAGVIHAEAGYIELAARKHGGDPKPDAVSHADLYSGLHAALGIAAALYDRERTGEGQRVEVSMAETVLFESEWTATEIAAEGRDLHHAFGPHNAPTLRLGDGTWTNVPGDPVVMFPAWVRAMRRPALLDDEKFATPQARSEHRSEMLKVLAEWAATFQRFEDYEAALGEVRLAAGAVRSVVEAAQSDWARARGALAEVDDRAGGVVRIPRAPLRFSDAEVSPAGPASYRGEHNREVLREVAGLGDAEIDGLERDGVISSRLPGPGSERT